MVEALPHKEAVTRFEEGLLDRWPAAERLDDPAACKRLGSITSRAWRIPGALVQPPHNILVMLDKDFPWTLPSIYLEESPDEVSFPHVEANGHLCLTRADAAFDVPVGISHLEQLIAEADALLAAGRAGTNNDDFLAEAQSYWSIGQISTSQILLIGSSDRSSSGFSTRVGRDFVVGATMEQLEKWCGSLGVTDAVYEPALFVDLPAPLLPSDYPTTFAELFGLVDSAGCTALLHQVLTSWGQRDSIPVVLSFGHDGRRVLLGGLIPRPSTLRMPGTRKAGVPGFKPYAGSPTSKRLALERYPGPIDRLRALPISRTDLLLRSSGVLPDVIRDARIAIVGCGAIGAPLALLMLQAGIGRIELIDPDTLDWRNIGRHALDGRAVGMNKASALARAALLRFPDAVVNAHATSWQRLFERDEAILANCDLIVSCTAHPASNQFMDQLIGIGDLPSTVFTWVEPFAFASHAIWRSTDGEGLARVLDRDGRMKAPVVDLATAPALSREPACGALYQPFSSLNAMQGVTMAGELALDALNGLVSTSVQRTWVGAAPELHRSGLALTPHWARIIHDHGYSRRYEFPLIHS